MAWGTDAIWTGAPQWQIEALRRLEIPEDMQTKYGFSPLGPADGPVKRAIFGENSARLYKYDIKRRAERDDRPDRRWPGPITSGKGRGGPTSATASCPTRSREGGGAVMKVSFFESGALLPASAASVQWPVPSGAYDREAGARAYRDMIARLQYVEELGFDWVSVSEHHYSPRILTPAPIVSASFIAAHLKKIKIALLGPIVPQSNPVRVAEEIAMLDTLAQGRLVVGLLRGTTNEYADLRPESRPRRASAPTRAWSSSSGPGRSRSRSAGRAAISSTGPSRSGRVLSSSPIRPRTPWGRAASRATSPRATTSAAACPYGSFEVGGPGHAVLPRAVRALRLGADAGADRLPGEHAAWPKRTRKPQAQLRQQPNQRAVHHAGGRARSAEQRWMPATSPARRGRRS